jgi:hypothetical protein
MKENEQYEPIKESYRDAEETISHSDGRNREKDQAVSEALQKLVMEFTGDEEMVELHGIPKEPLQIEDADKEKLSMIFHSQLYDAVAWYFGNSKEICDKYFTEEDHQLWKRLVLLGRIAQSVEGGLKEDVSVSDHPTYPDPFPEVTSRAFFVSSGHITVRSSDFHEDRRKPIFWGSGKYYRLFQSLQPEIDPSSGKACGTVGSKTVEDIVGHLTVDEAYRLEEMISAEVRAVQDYFSQKFGLSLGVYSIAGTLENFIKKYPNALSKDELTELQKQGKAPQPRK